MKSHNVTKLSYVLEAEREKNGSPLRMMLTQPVGLISDLLNSNPDIQRRKANLVKLKKIESKKVRNFKKKQQNKTEE